MPENKLIGDDIQKTLQSLSERLAKYNLVVVCIAWSTEANDYGVYVQGNGCLPCGAARLERYIEVNDVVHNKEIN